MLSDMKTTNYTNTFISVADDCVAEAAEIPPMKGTRKTAARIQYEMISGHPYKYTSDDVLFNIFASKHDISEEEKPEERKKFFSKGQPCLRSSALGKRYGWGVHSDDKGRVAIYAVGSDDYLSLKNDKNLKQIMAMRSVRK